MKRIRNLAVLAVLVPAAVVAAAPGTPQPSTKSNKMICKSFSQIGSLVARNRVCKTAAEWDANRSLLRQPTGTTSCGADGSACSVPGK